MRLFKKKNKEAEKVIEEVKNEIIEAKKEKKKFSLFKHQPKTDIQLGSEHEVPDLEKNAKNVALSTGIYTEEEWNSLERIELGKAIRFFNDPEKVRQALEQAKLIQVEKARQEMTEEFEKQSNVSDVLQETYLPEDEDQEFQSTKVELGEGKGELVRLPHTVEPASPKSDHSLSEQVSDKPKPKIDLSVFDDEHLRSWYAELQEKYKITLEESLAEKLHLISDELIKREKEKYNETLDENKKIVDESVEKLQSEATEQEKEKIAEKMTDVEMSVQKLNEPEPKKKFAMKFELKKKEPKTKPLKKAEAYCPTCKHTLMDHAKGKEDLGCQKCGCLTPVRVILKANELDPDDFGIFDDGKQSESMTVLCKCGHRQATHLKERLFCQVEDCKCSQYREQKEGDEDNEP